MMSQHILSEQFIYGYSVPVCDIVWYTRSFVDKLQTNISSFPYINTQYRSQIKRRRLVKFVDMFPKLLCPVHSTSAQL